MSLFLSATEREAVGAGRRDAPLRELYWALIVRVERRAATPGLAAHAAKGSWWYFAAEYLSEAAMAQALRPTAGLAVWLRSLTLSMARLSLADWVGPSFRDHRATPAVGHLETAHLTWGLATVVDLVPELFAAEELTEVTGILRERGLVLCERWTAMHDEASNWRCIMNAGAAVAASVLEDRAAMERAVVVYQHNTALFQDDGSYGETLQYANYAASGLMLAREALTRRDPALAARLPIRPQVLKSRWDAAALFYQKPLAGAGTIRRARSVNFGDSSAMHRPSADVLLHYASRGRAEDPNAAGLARWLFDQLYAPGEETGPEGMATFGFANNFGFLSVPLLTTAADARSPKDVGLRALEATQSGDVYVRDSWDGITVLAARTGGEALRSVAHHHGDMLSFMLVHQGERLLIDPGHACYRNLSREIDVASASHNTCTFTLPGTDGESDQILTQRLLSKRRINLTGEMASPPVPSWGRRWLSASDGEVRVIAAEAAQAYGAPVRTFGRFWFMGGAHTLFVVDHIETETPVRTTWHWHFNNRDSELNLKRVPPDRLVARRGAAACKLFHDGDGEMSDALHGTLHDVYHPLPGQPGEGRPGSGCIIRWTEREPQRARTVVHALYFGGPADITACHFKSSPGIAILEGPEATDGWKLETSHDPLRFVLTKLADGTAWAVEAEASGCWELKRRP